MAMTPDDKVAADECFLVVLACAGEAQDLVRRYEPIISIRRHAEMEIERL